MKKYYVSIPFQGSVSMYVYGENEEDAVNNANEKLMYITDEEIASNAEFDNVEIVSEEDF